MWQYNSPCELYHFGVLGMKWGKRKNNAIASYTKTYTPNKSDEKQFGKRGAQRIANDRSKGDSRPKALRKELGRTAIKIAGVTTVAYLLGKGISNGTIPSAAKKVLDYGKRIKNSYQNISILDSNGQVIKRYHSSVKVGTDVVSMILSKK